ncbi:hypothetical protein BDR05DRAFT_1018018 [Suillus weaverae]|nr:hypothetical protein BDR05DRAFT_1018018 [Suillus weaverae]
MCFWRLRSSTLRLRTPTRRLVHGCDVVYHRRLLLSWGTFLSSPSSRRAHCETSISSSRPLCSWRHSAYECYGKKGSQSRIQTRGFRLVWDNRRSPIPNERISRRSSLET